MGVAVFTIAPIVLCAVIITRAMMASAVILSPLKTPPDLERLGFNSEAATQRLLDEIAELNRTAVGAKPKTAIDDTNVFDTLAKLESPVDATDMRSVQSLIQSAFGREIVRMSGEITMRREGAAEILRLRLRRSPGHIVLIDVESARGPEDLFVQGALNLLEHIDPEIAAGIQWREFGNSEAALRLVALAIAGGDAHIQKFAFNLRSYIHATQGRIEEAFAASEQARKLDPTFFGADLSKSFALHQQKKFDLALAAAQDGIARGPQEPAAHSMAGLVLSALARFDDAIAAHEQAIRIGQNFAPAYRRLAVAQREAGRPAQASATLFTAAAVLPRSVGVLYDYAEDLRRNNRVKEAAAPLRQAYAINPDNLAVLVSLAETELDLGHIKDVESLNMAIRAAVDPFGHAAAPARPRRKSAGARQCERGKISLRWMGRRALQRPIIGNALYMRDQVTVLQISPPSAQPLVVIAPPDTLALPV